MKKLILIVGPAILTSGLMLISIFIGPAWSTRWVLAMPLVLVAMLFVRQGFFLPDDYLARWTKAHGVSITHDNKDVLLRYLRRGRRIRTLGGLAGCSTYVIWVNIIADDRIGVGWIRATFGGYLLGAAVAELWAFRRRPGAPHAAALVPRRSTDYIPSYALVTTRVVPLATLALTTAWKFIPKGRVWPPHPVRFSRPDIGEALAWTGVAILLALLVEGTVRRIVRRPQSASSEALIEADDAIRSTAMHGLIGASLALQLGILSRLAGRWTHFTNGRSVYSVLMVIGELCSIGAIFAWLRLGIDQPWIVRRTRSRQEAVA